MKKLILLILMGIPCLCFSQITIHVPFRGEPLFCKDPKCKRKIQIARQHRKNKKKQRHITFSKLSAPKPIKRSDTLYPILTQITVAADSIKNEADTLSILFNFDTYLLTPTATFLLDSLLSNTYNQPLIRVQLTGHTDSSGSLAYNMQLSKLRVKSVQDYLTQKGIASEIIYIDYVAYNKPLQTKNQLLQRRVEIAFTRNYKF